MGLAALALARMVYFFGQGRGGTIIPSRGARCRLYFSFDPGRVPGHCVERRSRQLWSREQTGKIEGAVDRLLLFFQVPLQSPDSAAEA